MGDFFMKFVENALLSLYLTILSLLLFELSYLLNFTIFSPFLFIKSNIVNVTILALLIELFGFYLFYLLYNYLLSKRFIWLNHLYKYIILGIADYVLLIGVMKIFNYFPKIQYLTTQICLFSVIIILKVINCYSIFYSNLIEYQRIEKRRC